MIVSPREAFVVSSENSVSDDDTGSNHSSPSTTGAAVDNKPNRESLIRSFNTNFYDSMGHYAIPMINNKATKTLFKPKTSDPVLAVWVDSWNTTVSQLSPESQKMFKASRHWPDRGFGGPRAVKQLFEVVVLNTYIAQICNIKLEEFRTLYEEIKLKLSELYLKSTIDSHEEETHCVQQLKDLKMQYKELQESVALMHEIPKPPKNILDEILEDYWESVCDFVEPAPCHKAESVPLREWSLDLKENNRLLAVEGIGHLDQYGTQCAGYMAPLGCRLQWVCEMR
jgi:hypothetical protein